MSAAIAAVLNDEDDDNGSYSAFPSLISSTAATKNKKQAPILASFDSDSFTILVDNGASRCMTNNVKHFISEPAVVNKVVKGLGAGKVTMEGTVRWLWEENLGACHTFNIPNTLYCADLAFCLLSPQHLATERQDNVPNERGTWLATYDDAMVLHWGQQMFQRTIKLSSNNAYVGLMRSAPGYCKSYKFLSLCALQLPVTALCFPAPVFHAETTEVVNQPDDDTPPTALDPDEDYNWVLLEAPARHEPLRFDFNPNHPGEPPTHNVDSSTTDMWTTDTPTSPQFDAAKQDLLTLHHRLGHMPFNQIMHMLSLKATPASKRMIDCQLPVCSACLFGKACKRAWRTKATNNKIKIAAAHAMLSPWTNWRAPLQASLPTTKRFTCATVLVDHFSRLTYVHLQESTGAVETLAAKHAFERFARTSDVTIKHYHGDNGRFSENTFRNDCIQQGQRLTFCGVNAHFQNGIAERRIRDLQDRASTMIVHAKHRWPTAITSNLWPYALRLANEGSRCIPIKEGKNPLQLFTGHDFQVAPHQHLHPFGCPMYVLKHGPASGQKESKWGERARCGIYLGLSPEHAHSVCLVLSLTTGMVSPPFHVKADEHFETVGPNSPSTASVYQSLLQCKHGFANESNGGVSRLCEFPTPPHNVRRIQPSPRFQPRQPQARSQLPPKSPKAAPDHLINRLPPTLAAPPPPRHRPDSDSDTDGEDEQRVRTRTSRRSGRTSRASRTTRHTGGNTLTSTHHASHPSPNQTTAQADCRSSDHRQDTSPSTHLSGRP
ncbi:hypothetical protein MHU86_1319 [Fragilaria crotonensis]|nr:hypothetical protein MHU86_1319 [Fragilaria crotonensis]